MGDGLSSYHAEGTMADRLRGVKVLVVEDEVLVGMELQMLLEDEGATVRLESTLTGGLAAAENGIDVAVLDVLLHGKEVFPLADRLAERGRPFVFHSGHADTDALEEAYRDASALAVAKPVRPAILVDAVTRQAALRRSRT